MNINVQEASEAPTERQNDNLLVLFRQTLKFNDNCHHCLVNQKFFDYLEVREQLEKDDEYAI